MEAVERNWAELPPELLLLIGKKLPEIPDFIRCRAICKPWRSSISLSDLPPQFPWILNLGKYPDMEFYSIASNKVYTIQARDSSDNWFFRPAAGYNYKVARQSGNGYIVALQSGNTDDISLLNRLNHISLLNPLNNSKVCLPDLHSSKTVLSLIGPQIFQRDDYVVVHNAANYIFVCKAGDDKWDRIGRSLYRTYLYAKSLLFMEAFWGNKVTKVMDIESRKEVYVIPHPKYENLSKFSNSAPYFVESCGEILRLCCSYSIPYEFDIHRLEFGNGKGDPCWVKVRSIGDQMLFFDFTIGHGFSLRANDLAGCKGNCIYFTNGITNGRDQACSLGMYDIENGSTVSIDYPFDRKNGITWFVPTLNHI